MIYKSSTTLDCTFSTHTELEVWYSSAEPSPTATSGCRRSIIPRSVQRSPGIPRHLCPCLDNRCSQPKRRWTAKYSPFRYSIPLGAYFRLVNRDRCFWSKLSRAFCGALVNASSVEYCCSSKLKATASWLSNLVNMRITGTVYCQFYKFTLRRMLTAFRVNFIKEL